MEHSKLYWEFVEECKAEGRAEAKAEAKAEIAVRLSKHGMDIGDIAQIIDTNIENVQKWLTESVHTVR